MRFLSFPQIFWAAFKAFFSDNVPRMGASLSYYTLFAIGPVLLIAVEWRERCLVPRRRKGRSSASWRV